MKKYLANVKAYLANFLFYLQNNGKKLGIKQEHVQGRGYSGIVTGFNFKTGKIDLAVFDFGMYFPRAFEKNQLDGD